jgi:predicted carbohydrate-binding protein with CBM5 and CBM33 domain
MRVSLPIALILSISSLLFGHGTLESPKSRVRRVYEALSVNPMPPWAAQAVALDGSLPYYTWNQLSRNFTTAINGDWQPYVAGIPDGQLASAGSNPTTANLPGHPGLSFSGLDTVSPSWDWPATTVSAGVNAFRFHATAPHDPSYFHVWISKPGYDVKTALRWQDLDYLGQPVVTKNGNFYDFPVTLPARTGRAVVYVAWQRIDLGGEVFFALSDLDFSGAPSGPVVGFSSPTVTVAENVGQAAVQVFLNQPAPSGGVTVQYATTPGTAAQADFTATSGTLTFAAGESSKTLQVPIIDDAVQELAESFTVTLTAPTGATLGQATSTVTISANDVPVATGGGYRFIVTQNWGSGWEGRLEIVNPGPAAWNPWRLEFDAHWTISNAYNAMQFSRVGDHYIYDPHSWNGVVPAGGTLVFDWLVSNAGSHGAHPPTNVMINGQLIPLITPVVWPPALEPVSANTVALPTESGRQYRLQRSPDLLNWTSLTTHAGTGSRLVIQDTNPPAGASRMFYRVERLP